MEDNIDKIITDGFAGIKSLKFININYVDSVENGVLTLKQGNSLKEVYVCTGKWNMQVEQNKDDNTYYDVKLSGVISKHDKTVLANSVLMSDADLILQAELDNITYIIGNLDEGVHFKFSEFTGTLPGDESGYNLNFYRKLRHPLMVLKV